jgi:hypothetical protein
MRRLSNEAAASYSDADGFHRVSLVYRLDPFAEVPLKLA